MKTEAEAAHLAELMVETGARMGKRVVALLTDMDQPLGRAVGNSLEVIEAFEVLEGRGPADLRELCLELAGWMFELGGKVTSLASGKEMAAGLIASGKAKEKFREIIRLQGGDAGVADGFERLPRAAHTFEVVSGGNGYVVATECEQLGLAALALGGGRAKKEDTIDPAVGLTIHQKIGDSVRMGEPLCTLHYNDAARLAEARRLVEGAYQFGHEPPSKQLLVRRIIGG
jgi:thymidine phosphorylase